MQLLKFTFICKLSYCKFNTLCFSNKLNFVSQWIGHTFYFRFLVAFPTVKFLDIFDNQLPRFSLFQPCFISTPVLTHNNFSTLFWTWDWLQNLYLEHNEIKYIHSTDQTLSSIVHTPITLCMVIHLVCDCLLIQFIADVFFHYKMLTLHYLDSGIPVIATASSSLSYQSSEINAKPHISKLQNLELFHQQICQHY
jgi:hypothetical protein